MEEAAVTEEGGAVTAAENMTLKEPTHRFFRP